MGHQASSKAIIPTDESRSKRDDQPAFPVQQMVCGPYIIVSHAHRSINEGRSHAISVVL